MKVNLICKSSTDELLYSINMFRVVWVDYISWPSPIPIEYLNKRQSKRIHFAIKSNENTSFCYFSLMDDSMVLFWLRFVKSLNKKILRGFHTPFFDWCSEMKRSLKTTDPSSLRDVTGVIWSQGHGGKDWRSLSLSETSYVRLGAERIRTNNAPQRFPNTRTKNLNHFFKTG